MRFVDRGRGAVDVDVGVDAVDWPYRLNPYRNMGRGAIVISKLIWQKVQVEHKRKRHVDATTPPALGATAGWAAGKQ